MNTTKRKVTKLQPAKRKVAAATSKKPALPLSLVQQALRSPQAAQISRTLHGALNDAVATLAPLHGLDLAQRVVGEILSDTPPPVDLPSPRPPVSTTLSSQASELVRWYCTITKHFEHNTVEGAVFGVLERAKDAYEGTPGMDEAFDWLMEDVIRAKNDDIRFPVHRAHHGGYTVQLGQTARELLFRFTQENGGDVRDIVSAALESVLRCVLEDGEVGFPEAHRRARQQRVAEEAESQQRAEMFATFHAPKEVAA